VLTFVNRFIGLFTPKKCFKNCMNRCYKKHPLHTEEEADTEEEAEGTLVERSEAADLATAEAQGIIEIDACGWTKQTWCATKASLAIWKDFDDVYVWCMAECFSEE
jgi:hypothetical protein